MGTDRTERRWDKAVVVGSIWASVEIILGSTLHNLRFPFSGSLLAAIGVVLITSFLLRWKEHGIVFRAALVCALMKSVSPSAVILGPMTGILLEGILMELAFRITGFNLAGALLAGVLAVSSALVHKLINLLLIYGQDIITIYLNVFQFAARQLTFGAAGMEELLYLLLGGYLLFGILAGGMGFSASRARNQAGHGYPVARTWQKPQDTVGELTRRAAWLFLHIMVLPAGLYVMNAHGPILFLSLSAPYLLFVFIRYRRVLRRIARPAFWYQMAIIAILSTLFWEFPSPEGMYGSREGFLNGLELILRALFVVSAFSAISVELRNPAVESFLKKYGFRRLHAVMEVAFGLLPDIIQRMPGMRQILRHPLRSLASLNLIGDELLTRLGQEGQERNPS